MKFSAVSVYVADVQQTLAFYEAAFGMATQYIHESGAYAELASEGVKLAFTAAELGRSNLGVDFYANRADQLPAGVLISLSADDIAQAFAQALAAGASAVAAPETKPWGQQVAYLRDPNGLLIELAKWIG